MGQVNESVHNRIALLRAEQGVSRRDLAVALGVHYQTIGYLERGENSPSLNLALRIAPSSPSRSRPCSRCPRSRASATRPVHPAR